MLTYTIIFLVGTCAVTYAGLGNLASNRGVKPGTDNQRDIPDHFVGCLRSEGAFQVAGVPGGGPDEINECMFYECEGNEWVPKLCPDKLGILKSQFDKAGRSNVYPCVKPSTACLSSLSDRGVENTATSVCGVDVVCMVDVSCSISLLDKGKVKTFLRKFASVFPIGPVFTQMSGLVYGSAVLSFLHFNSYNNAKGVRDAIKNMPLDAKPCATHTFEALRMAREVHLTSENGRRDGPPDPRPCMGLLMTDGFTHPQSQKDETIRQAKEFRKHCPLILVTLPSSSDNNIPLAEKTRLREEEFSKIQPDPDYRLDLDSFDQLDASINEIARKTCQPVKRI